MGFGDWLAKAGSAIETGSDWIGVDKIGKFIDDGLEGTGELADDLGLDNAYDPVMHKVVQPAWSTSVDAYNWTRTNAISRPLATTQLLAAANPETGGLGILTPDSWRDAWNMSRDVSPGQAAIGNIAGGLGQANQELLGRTMLPGNLDPLADPNFDISDPAQREKVFGSGVGMLLSGTVDAAASWFLDPLVLAGTAVKVGRVALVDQPVGGLRVEKLTQGADRRLAPADLTEEGKAALQTRLDDIVEGRGRAGRRLDAYAERYMNMSEQRRHLELMRDPNLRQAPELAAYLARSESKRDFKLRSRLAMNPTWKNVDLAEQNSIKSSLEYWQMHDETIPGLNAAFDDAADMLQKAKASGDPQLIKRAEAQERKAAVLLKRKTRELKAAGDARDDALLAYGSAGRLQNVPRTRMSQKATDAWRETTGLDWWTYQPSKYSGMRVLRSAATRRAGIVHHDDPSDAVTQVTRALDRVGHGVKRGRGGVAAGIDEETRYLILSRISDAALLRSVPEMQAAIRDAEVAIVSHLAKLHDIPEDTAQMLYNGMAEKRSVVLNTMQMRTKEGGLLTDADGNPIAATSPGGMFSGAQIGDEWTMTADQIKNVDGQLERHPLGQTDLENITPLMDVDAMSRLIERNKYLLQMQSTDVMDVMRGNVANASAEVREARAALLDGINRYWKPAQLLRLGWPMRVVFDETLRSMAVIGTMQHLTLQIDSAYNSLSQGKLNYRFRDGAAKARNRITQNRQKLAELEPVSKDARKRAVIVEELAAVGEARVRLKSEIDQARTTLAEAMAVNGGRRAYMTAGRRAGITGRPGGTTFRLDDYDPAAVSGNVHDRIINDIDPAEVHITSSTLKPGIGYLEDTMARGEFADLRGLSRRALAEKVAAEFPDLPIGGFRRTEDLLAAYGAQKAKAAGFRAVERAGEEITVLDDALIRNVDPAEADAIRRLEDLREEQFEWASLHKELTNSTHALKEWTDGMQEDYEKLLKRAKLPSSRTRGDKDRPLKFAGDLTLTRNGVSVKVPDAFGGTYGRVFMDLTSAKANTQAMLGTSKNYLNGNRIVVGEPVILRPIVPDTLPADQQLLVRQTYAKGWEHSVNEQIAKDPMMRQILQDRTDDEILDWLNGTAAGQETLRKLGPVRRARKEEWIKNARVHVQHMLPVPELRELALQGRASIDDLHSYKRGAGLTDADLPVVHSQSLQQVLTESKFMPKLDALIDKAYAKIGTAPTDVLSRHPFFAGIYRKEMREQYEALQITRGDFEDDIVPTSVLQRMERNARQTALREVKRTLYDVANESNLAHTMRFIMPFYAAWQDALQTWARIWTQDPATLARITQIWQAPNKTPASYENSFGEKFMVLPIPDEIKGVLGLPQETGMPSKWMRDLIFNGEYWYNPGMGAPVTVPMGMLLRDRPDLESALKPFLPYGAGDSWVEQVFPAGWQKAAARFQEEDSEPFAKSQWRLFQDIYVENQLHDLGKTNLQMWDESKQRASHLMGLRGLANLTAPFPPDFRSPFQYHIDKFRTMQEQHRADPNVFGGKSAQDHFIDTEGEEFFILTLAATKSNVGGIAPTQEGYAAFNEYQDLVREMPELGSLIVGDTNGEYSPAVAEWMERENIGPGDHTKIRERRDPRQGLIDAETNRGWSKYRKLDNMITAMMEAEGLDNLRTKAAQPIAELRKVLIDAIAADYPAWKQDFDTVDRGRADRRVAMMHKLVDDPRMVDRPGFRSLAQYLNMRDGIVGMLATREAAGGSPNLQADSNEDLALIFESVTNNLKLEDTEFAELHTRWLGSDNLTTGGVA